MNKKQLSQFNKEARTILEQLEAYRTTEINERNGTSFDRIYFDLPKLGIWVVSLETEVCKSKVWTIYSRFNDTEYKGQYKHNFHEFDSVDCLDEFMSFVDELAVEANQ